ncbi:phage tail-collar fiber domain-containing protein [Citrobacter freundii]|uniref:phage tail-collar fiber domain-containing protein n=1 Tax=Citrobacter freundii TaxID=546 RepID=UPI001F093951|nr:phage tail protein [Citrobacter freundii]MEB0958600.1 phage tail protein [Citrobacter freundii]
MSKKFKTIITTAGAEKLAAATVPGGKKVNLTAMAVGDGGGTLPEPDAGQTKLINEVWRHALNKVSQDNKNKNYIVAELVIPPDVGGFWMRELGLYDDAGTLIAVANMAESYKPKLAEGSGRAQTCRMVIIVSSVDSVALSIDATTVMATQDYVDDKIAEHEKSRNHPDATLNEKGFTQLSSSTDSTSESLAATPKAVKAAYDLANGKYTAQDASTGQKGIVQLSSATDSNDEGKAATPKAVKAAYDLANGKYTAQDASTGQKGIVQLSSATDSNDERKAATPKAVKAANDNADKRLAKEQNGKDVPEKDVFVRNVGAARAFSGSVSIGGGGNWTTAEFIVWLENQGAFNHPYWMCKGSWSYGDNRTITDTGCGNIQLAGAVVEVLGVRGAMTIRVTTASTGGGTLSAQFTYINHGDDYSPGWRRDLKRSGDTMLGELKIHGANALRIFDEQRGLIFRRSEESLHLIPTLENQGENGDIGPLRPLSINLRTGEVMMGHKLLASGGAQISSSLGIGVDNVLGENSIVLGDADTGLKQNGDGVLDSYSNGRQVMRIVPDAVQVFGWTGSWIDMRVQPCFTSVLPVNVDGASAIVRHEHPDRHFILGGLGNHQFGIYMINKSRSVNGTDGQAFMNSDGDWVSGGRILPGNYENFDARYQLRGNYATQEWVLQNFVQNIRQSGVAYIDAEKNSGQRLVPAGGVLIGSQVNGEWDNNEGFYYTWIQQNINGNWLTIGRV